MPINAPVFQAGGLGSGLDTNGIVDAMVGAEAIPMNRMQSLQSAYKMQVSTLGDLSSKLDALSTAAQALGTNGVVGNTVQSSNVGFSATPDSSAVPGSYAVQVNQLAQAAKARSQAFTDAYAPVTGGTLTLSVAGVDYAVTIADGDPLQAVASAINRSGAPVAAAVLSSTTGAYLSITARDTGFPVGQTAAAALTLTESSTGTQGQALSASIITPAQNAKVTVDGLDFESASNAVANAVPGAVLQLTQTTNAPENLVIGNDTSATEKNLQTFVDAYNAVMGVVNKQLDVTSKTDRDATLAGDPSLRSLQQTLHDLITTVVNPSSSVRSLADLGVKSDQKTGQLSIDETALAKALSNDGGAVNALFQTASTGLSALTRSMVDRYTDPVDGVFVAKTKGLNDEVSQMSDELTRMQAHLDAYKASLLAQFSAMEQVVGTLKNVGAYLTQMEAQNTKNNNG